MQNNILFSVDNVKIKRDGTYKFSGKAKNFAGQKARLSVKGKFKNARKIVQKTTIKIGSCQKSAKAKLKRQA
ncbi:MAG: hypothetical protein IPK93_02225 [Solirubrobacterales bacterium]|nr:hypothetical protein [Solirubrobacterales bacterium]